MQTIRTTSGEAFLTTAVSQIGEAIRACTAKGLCIIGLSGGSTPGPVYRELSKDGSIQWERVTFFLVDERFVPANDLRSNQKLFRETFLQGLAARAKFLAPNTSLPVLDCVQAYDAQLRGITPDILILGMGEDGHIASLFPPLAASAQGPASVIHTTTDTFAVHDRISVTLPLLTRAKRAFFLVTGPKKAALLAEMERSKAGIMRYPALAFPGDTVWILG